jgi:hypothetical protein
MRYVNEIRESEEENIPLNEIQDRHYTLTEGMQASQNHTTTSSEHQTRVRVQQSEGR